MAGHLIRSIARAYLLKRGHELRCAICGREEPQHRLCVDHSHTSGKLRGFLCAQCNVGLGMFRDSPEIVDQAASYLRRTA